jgi:hypothetical protein
LPSQEQNQGQPRHPKAQVYLQAGFSDKEKVKALGARFDARRKQWFVPYGADITPFLQWIRLP